jgi:DNA-binding NtrC family response regulator
MHAGRLRADLYYRICADVIRTPALREQLADAPGDLGNLVRIVARRIAGAETAEALAREVEAWVTAHLGSTYTWPGNMRELEQCVRNILIRGEYVPPSAPTGSAGAIGGASPAPGGGMSPALADPFLAAVHAGTLTAEEVLQGYCARVHARSATYHDAARRLRLDWRTVRLRVHAWAARDRRA